VLDDRGQALPDRCCGTIHVRGPSVMSGYFEDAAATAEALSADGWLNTGDTGYLERGAALEARARTMETDVLSRVEERLGEGER